MLFQSLVFLLFAVLLIYSALRVITVRNPVHAVLFLVLSFFASAGLWLLLEAEFLAITLVLVYVGAVMVLFLFVVMMLDINIAELREGFTRYLPLGAGVAVLLTAGMTLTLLLGDFLGKGAQGSAAVPHPVPHPAPHPASYSNIAEIGGVLYTDYVYPFEIAAVVLLVAIVAAIAITLRPTRASRSMRVEEQLKARREDRVRLVKIPAETLR